MRCVSETRGDKRAQASNRRLRHPPQTLTEKVMQRSPALVRRRFPLAIASFAVVALSLSQACLALPQPVGVVDPLRIWVGTPTPDSIERWVDYHVKRFQGYRTGLLAPRKEHTVKVDLAFYDAAQTELDLAGTEAFLMNSVSPDTAVRAAASKQAQRVSELGNEFGLNHEVYQVLAAIDLAHADAATRHYVERARLEYRLAGADKDPVLRAKLKTLLDETSKQQIAFSHNIAESVNLVKVTDPKDLAGLPDDFVKAHPPGADGVITLTSNEPDFDAVSTYASNSGLRRRMLLAYTTRAYPENRAVLLAMLRARREVAQLLGYSSWPQFALADQMMETPEKLKAFISRVDEATRVQAQHEYQEILDYARSREAGITGLDDSNLSYWREQYRKATLGFDSQEARPYFPYPQVEAGVLKVMGRLFHVEFVRVADAPVWDPSVTAWDLIDHDAASPRRGKTIGRIYLDMHPREGKDKWFNGGSVISGILGKQLPEGRLLCNFPGPGKDDPGLMQYDDVVVFFHELGHLMHSTLGGFQRYDGISGISTENDFVEAPSQMLEEFFRDPAILQSFARHYQSGAVMPSDLIARMNRSSAFGRALWARAQLRYTAASFDVHDADPDTLDLDRLWNDDQRKYVPNAPIEGEHRFESFGHLAAYTSNYYTYLADKVIAIDFFEQFDGHNLLDGPMALNYRHKVLEPGGSKPAQQLVDEFLGRDQSFDAFARWVGEGTKPL
jgi:thimet oligopeptidase